MEGPFKGRGIPRFDALAQLLDQGRTITRQERRYGEDPFLRLPLRKHERTSSGQLSQLDFLSALQMLHQLLFDVFERSKRLILGSLHRLGQRGIDLARSPSQSCRSLRAAPPEVTPACG